MSIPLSIKILRNDDNKISHTSHRDLLNPLLYDILTDEFD